MKANWKVWALALVAGSMMVACSESDNNENPDPTPGPGEQSILSGNITGDLRLAAHTSHKLYGGVHVKDGATLYIEEGVQIEAVDDDLPDYILVEQGAKIHAVGTASDPIVMTGELKKAGAWGGIHLCGYAHTNSGEGTLSEIGNAPYGGTNDQDNSGVLKYIRLEYTGFALDEEHEANGVSFYGVGNGTTVEYLQAYQGSDDGFEFFGGSVDVKHLVATSCSDDSFDWTEGWNGRAQFLVAVQEPSETLGYDCDCLMECDNNGDNFAATPVAHPVIANVTLIGNLSSEAKRGVRLRAGTEVELYNALISGKSNALTVESIPTEEALANGISKLAYVLCANALSSKEGIFDNAAFLNGEGNSDNYVSAQADYRGVVDGGKTLSDSFFTAAPYCGAVEADADWTASWTR